jgi:hypothetical protein
MRGAAADIINHDKRLANERKVLTRRISRFILTVCAAPAAQKKNPAAAGCWTLQ